MGPVVDVLAVVEAAVTVVLEGVLEGVPVAPVLVTVDVLAVQAAVIRRVTEDARRRAPVAV